MANLHEALRVSQSDKQGLVLIKKFSSSIKALSFPHRVTEDSNDIVMWVYQEDHIALCQQLFQRFLDNDLPLPTPSKAKNIGFSLQRLASFPVVVCTAILCCLGYSLLFIESWQLISLFSFQGLSIEQGELIVNRRDEVWQLLQSGQLWRLITPIFLHFSLMHIVFNTVLFVYFAKQIEEKEGSFNLLSDILLLALMSNLAQFCFVGDQLFGGLSGVVYGLMAYSWAINQLRKQAVFHVPQGLMLVSVIMMGLGFLGIFSLMALSIANWAHLVGLLTGIALAFMRK